MPAPQLCNKLEKPQQSEELIFQVISQRDLQTAQPFPNYEPNKNYDWGPLNITQYPIFDNIGKVSVNEGTAFKVLNINRVMEITNNLS